MDTQQNYQILLEPFRLGKMNMKNKLVVPSINRMRATIDDQCPTDLVSFYYSQRYHNSLIITENCLVSGDQIPFKGQPGLYSQKQIDSWREVVDKVHSRSTNIIASLFHPGRVVGSNQTKQNEQNKKILSAQNHQQIESISASAVQIEGTNRLVGGKFKKVKMMTKEDIKQVINQFKQAALNAQLAGFDGVQIEGGRGFLIDQFLSETCNQREDEYGGSIENRCRLCLQIVDEIIVVSGNNSSRVSIKFSPMGNDFNVLMKYLLKELEKRKICFVELRSTSRLDQFFQVKQVSSSTQKAEGETLEQQYLLSSESQPECLQNEEHIFNYFFQLRQLFDGNLIANGDFNNSISLATKLISEAKYQACSFDTLSITNPDLPQRLKERGNINKQLREIFLFQGERHGYIDYPFYIAHSKF